MCHVPMLVLEQSTKTLNLPGHINCHMFAVLAQFGAKHNYGLPHGPAQQRQLVFMGSLNLTAFRAHPEPIYILLLSLYSP